MLKFEPVQNIFEGFFDEINLRKKSGFFPAHIIQIKKIIVNHVKNISTELDQFSATYDNLILIRDFNVEPEEENMLDFIKYVQPEKSCETKDMLQEPWQSFMDRSFQNNNVFD